MSAFTLFDVPYFNALTAGEFDASSTFDANMPASHVAYSLQTLGLYQSPGQTVRPNILKWGDPPTVGAPEPDCGVFELDCQLEKFLGSAVVKDYSKRVGLVLVAVILIVVAIVSLR
jgi:hypothetical protein